MTIQSSSEFARLRQSEDPADQRRATHEDASVDVWRAVIADYPELREWVAHNKQVSVEILWELAHDPSVRVRSSVAMKRKLDRRTFDLLAADPVETVRCRIGCNPRVPADLAERLAEDPDAWVRGTVRERLGRRAS
ncbi:hypothetical protein [Paraconexibacter sp. AEG42_29]|uniref:hypothetical protein n=1 Tax=Paraconexibacter sp. AEG42_29 TaxID=2997339 RepID=UPI00339DA67A